MSAMPRECEEALRKYKEIRVEHEMCSVWTCPRKRGRFNKMCDFHVKAYREYRRKK